MYIIKKSFEIAGAHKLNLPYKSPCGNWHGHNWKITVHMSAITLKNGMVADFSQLKKLISGKLDHRLLNNVVAIPTAEFLANWIFLQVNKKFGNKDLGRQCFKVEVEESTGSLATYEI